MAQRQRTEAEPITNIVVASEKTMPLLPKVQPKHVEELLGGVVGPDTRISAKPHTFKFDQKRHIAKATVTEEASRHEVETLILFGTSSVTVQLGRMNPEGGAYMRFEVSTEEQNLGEYVSGEVGFFWEGAYHAHTPFNGNGRTLLPDAPEINIGVLIKIFMETNDIHTFDGLHGAVIQSMVTPNTGENT